MGNGVRLSAAAAMAAAGLAAGVATGDLGPHGFGAIRTPTAATTDRPRTAGDLAGRLAEIRQSLGIRPDQETAWQAYAGTMQYLDRATQDFEDRRAHGGTPDDDMERNRHALILGAAIGDLQRALAPEQFARARRLTEDLASTVTCTALGVR